jgi:hypothetical protein
MSDKAAKQVRKVGKIIRGGFEQDYGFFIGVLKSWTFGERLRFCRDLLLQRL